MARSSGKWLLASLGLVALAGGCKDGGTAEGSTDSEGIELTTGGGNSESGPVLDVNMADSGNIGCGEGVGECSDQLDLLFIIDNSGSMGEEQQNLASNLPGLVRALENLTDPDGNPVAANVHIMVTTTDSGNVLCDPYYKPGRSPEEGAPISDACTDRLDRFESVGVPPVNAESACTSVCPTPLAPEGDYISFAGSTDNVPDVPPADIDGDGMDDSPVAQTLSCVGPQGIDGCGYESPLESMLQALDPNAAWNQGAEPFRRPGSLLAVAVITDETDCSVVDDSVMMDTQYQEDNPDTNMPVPSSAICWNAGVTCDGPDGNGIYTNCHSTGEQLRPVQEYIDFLQSQEQGGRVVMLGIVGIPVVTERNPDPPYQPIAGGVLDLVYRDWQDPEYPTGDILPDEWAQGIDAAYKQYQFGIGPGCTGQDDAGNFTGQGVPPMRIQEVCQALDITDDPATPDDETEIRCCMESICDTDFSPALQCLTGLIQENFIPPA